MKTEVLNLRVPVDEWDILCKAAERCGISHNQMGVKMIIAAANAIRDYEGPIIPLTLQFPHKIEGMDGNSGYTLNDKPKPKK